MEGFLHPDCCVKQSGLQTIYISGQVGVDHTKHLVGDGSLAAQTGQAFKNLATALASVGATTADIIKTTIYVVNYQPADAVVIGEIIRQHFHHPLPACSLLGVQSLAHKEFLIEVEAVAIVETND